MTAYPQNQQMHSGDGGLKKHPTILSLLDRLRSRLGPNSFLIQDHWEADLQAIGIANPRDHRVLVYISTYGQPLDHYSYELELPPPPGAEVPYAVAGSGWEVSFEELWVVVSEHLKVA